MLLIAARSVDFHRTSAISRDAEALTPASAGSGGTRPGRSVVSGPAAACVGYFATEVDTVTVYTPAVG